MLENSQLSLPARYLYCVLLKYCRQNDTCFPGQERLANILGRTERHVRTLLNELEKSELIYWTRTGFNRPNTYTLAKSLERKPISAHLGSVFPLHRGNDVPNKNTYPRIKANKGNEIVRNKLISLGLKSSIIK